MNHDAKINLMGVTDEMNYAKSLAWAIVKALGSTDSVDEYDGAAHILFERVTDPDTVYRHATWRGAGTSVGGYQGQSHSSLANFANGDLHARARRYGFMWFSLLDS